MEDYSGSKSACFFSIYAPAYGVQKQKACPRGTPGNTELRENEKDYTLLLQSLVFVILSNDKQWCMLEILWRRKGTSSDKVRREMN